MSLTIWAGATGNIGMEVDNKDASYTKKDGNMSINAANLRLEPDAVSQRKKQAQEEAWRVISAAWENERAIDNNIKEKEEHYKEMTALLKEDARLLKQNEEELLGLKEAYGIEEGSKEDKDIELLIKYENKRNGVVDEAFSEEEKERLGKLLAAPLTEVQKHALDINARAISLKKEMNNAKLHMQNDMNYVTSVSIERLKSHAMADANKQAKEILEAASKEIVGMLIEESKEHIDEQLEEEKEKAEAVKEKQEEETERLAELKEERAIKEAMILETKEAIEEAERVVAERKAANIDVDNMVEISVESMAVSNEAQQSLDKLKNSMALLEADLKGIKVDKTV